METNKTRRREKEHGDLIKTKTNFQIKRRNNRDPQIRNFSS